MTSSGGVEAAETRASEVRDERGYFEGYQERNCGDHRTVGSHRAWCYECSEWCYPGGGADDACNGCAVPMQANELTRLRAEVADLRAKVDAVRAVLVDLDNGGHASSGRDFGRGAAYAARLITAAITERQETRR